MGWMKACYQVSVSEQKLCYDVVTKISVSRWPKTKCCFSRKLYQGHILARSVCPSWSAGSSAACIYLQAQDDRSATISNWHSYNVRRKRALRMRLMCKRPGLEGTSAASAHNSSARSSYMTLTNPWEILCGFRTPVQEREEMLPQEGWCFCPEILSCYFL